MRLKALENFKIVFTNSSWAVFSSDPPTKKILQDLLVMTNMGINSCRVALLAMAASAGVHDTEPEDFAMEIFKRTRDACQRQIIASPELSSFLKKLRLTSQRPNLYPQKPLAAFQQAGPKLLEQSIAEFSSHLPS